MGDKREQKGVKEDFDRRGSVGPQASFLLNNDMKGRKELREMGMGRRER